MKRLLPITILILVLITSCSSAVVSYLSTTPHGEVLANIDCGGQDTVYFYTDENVYDIEVATCEYNEQNAQYSVTKVCYTTGTLNKNCSLKILLDLNAQIPYARIKYQRENGSTRMQYIYRDTNGKLWLLEQK